ncbi:MAG: hypothetical protein GY820_44675 [Gammaproteobacteria bacterium]|nr:hypothetical protein [Gammaproteobacteria bacterium]
MFLTFAAEVKSGKICINEFNGEDRLLDGKDVTVLSLGATAKLIFQGIYKTGQEVIDFTGDTLVILHQKVDIAGADSIFDEKYQLGSQVGDCDN